MTDDSAGAFEQLVREVVLEADLGSLIDDVLAWMDHNTRRDRPNTPELAVADLGPVLQPVHQQAVRLVQARPGLKLPPAYVAACGRVADAVRLGLTTVGRQAIEGGLRDLQLSLEASPQA